MKEFSVVRSFLDNRKRKLLIDNSKIQFENSDLREGNHLILLKEDIVGFRYGINFIRGYKFYIGRDYQIFIETNTGKDLKINFKTFYSLNLQKTQQLYLEIINELWHCFFNEIVQVKFKQWKEQNKVEINKFKFDKNGIFNSKTKIEWESVDIANYHHYYVIYSKKDPNMNIMVNFRMDKSSVVIWSLIESILKYLNYK